MSDDKMMITKKGLEELTRELEERKTIVRDKIADQIAQARDQGDLSENAAYSSAMEAKQFNETRIEDLENLIKNSVVIKTNTKDKFVGLGESVTIVRESDKKEFQYMIVGENESNPKEGRISIKSPIGKALVGKKAGDVVDTDLPTGKVSFKITKIN